MASGSKTWSLFSIGAAMAAATVAKKGLNTSWKVATGKNPPADPSNPDVELREAVTWAVLSGTIIGVARMLATRRAAHYYRRSTGKNPRELPSG